MNEGGSEYGWSREKNIETQQLGFGKVFWKKEDLIRLNES